MFQNRILKLGKNDNKKITLVNISICVHETSSWATFVRKVELCIKLLFYFLSSFVAESQFIFVNHENKQTWTQLNVKFCCFFLFKRSLFDVISFNSGKYTDILFTIYFRENGPESIELNLCNEFNLNISSVNAIA